MNMRFLLLPAFAVLTFGQAMPNSVTVTATRNINPQPDQVVFGVNVVALLDATRDDVIAALQGSGLTASNFSGVQTVQMFDPQGRPGANALSWSFNLPVPISGMKSTIGLLTAVQSSLANKKNGMSMSFGVQGIQVSPQALQSQTCSLTDLMSDARAQAQKLAAVGGAIAGAVLAVSGAAVVTDGNNPFAGQGAVSPVCSMTVKFALTGGF